LTTTGYQLSDESAQFSSEAASGGQVDVEVARVVRHAEFLDDRSHVVVGVVARPGGVGGTLGRRYGRVAFLEAQVEDVADGDGQRGGDEVERDSEQRERRRRRTTRSRVTRTEQRHGFPSPCR